MVCLIYSILAGHVISGAFSGTTLALVFSLLLLDTNDIKSKKVNRSMIIAEWKMINTYQVFLYRIATVYDWVEVTRNIKFHKELHEIIRRRDKRWLELLFLHTMV